MDSPFSLLGVQTKEQGFVPSVFAPVVRTMAAGLLSAWALLIFAVLRRPLSAGSSTAGAGDSQMGFDGTSPSPSVSLCLCLCPRPFESYPFTQKWTHHFGWNILCLPHGSLKTSALDLNIVFLVFFFLLIFYYEHMLLTDFVLCVQI